jgi:hypothetical protein
MDQSQPQLPPDSIMQPVLDFWTQYLQQALAGRRDSVLSEEQALQWRDRWLEAARKSLDAYMRTPPFLEAMKCNIDAMIRLKQHADQLNQQLASAVTGGGGAQTRDVLERLESLEQSIVARLESIEERLDRLDTPPAQSPKTRSRKTAKKGK